METSVIDARSKAGETWVTLAGVPFRVSPRRYGQSKTIVLRTEQGVAYRLAPSKGYLEGTSYIHDVTLEEHVYRVHVAPAGSPAAKAVLDPPDAGHGVPVLLVGATIFALRRVPALDGKPVLTAVDDTRHAEVLEKVGAFAKTHGLTVQAAIALLLDSGLRRRRAEEAHKSKRQIKRRK